MRIFAYEWTCCVEDAPPSLCREGWAMLWAVLQDFAASRALETVTLVHDNFSHQSPEGVQCVRIRGDEEGRFRELAGGADYTLVIAPETGNIMAERACWVAQAGGRLLGPTVDAIVLCTDKLLCAANWRQHGVPTPPTRQLSANITYPAVLKPRDGAGSQATFLMREAGDLQRCLQQARAEGATLDFIVQDFVAGQPASIAFLLGQNIHLPLLPALQLVSDDGRFHYRGGVVPLPPQLAARAMRLGQLAVEAVPGLRGYVGVDLILGEADDASGDYAIEINPRLTTSYLGLRRLTGDNLALAMLNITLGQEVGGARWRDHVIRFHTDGQFECT